MAPAVQTLLANVERDTSTINSGPNVTVVVCGVVVGVILVAGIMIPFFVLRGRRRRKEAESDGDKTQKIPCHKHTRSDTIDTPLLNIPHWLSISDGSEPHADHSSRPSSEQIHELDRSNYSFSLSEQVPFALYMVGTPIAVSQRAADSHRPSNKSSSRDLPRLTIPNCLPSPAKPTIPPLMMTSTMKSFSAPHTQSLSICMENSMSAFPQPPAKPPIVVAQTPLLPMPEHHAPISLDDSHSPVAANTLDTGRLFTKRSKRNSNRNLSSVSWIKRQDSVKSTASPDVSNDRMLSMKTNVIARNSLSGPMSALTDGPLSAVSLDPNTPSTIRTMRGLVPDFPVPPPCSLSSLSANIFLKETTPQVPRHRRLHAQSLVPMSSTSDGLASLTSSVQSALSTPCVKPGHAVDILPHSLSSDSTMKLSTINTTPPPPPRRQPVLPPVITPNTTLSEDISYSSLMTPRTSPAYKLPILSPPDPLRLEHLPPSSPLPPQTSHLTTSPPRSRRPFLPRIVPSEPLLSGDLISAISSDISTPDTIRTIGGLAPDFPVPPASPSPMLRTDILTNTTASAPAQQQSFLLPRSHTERKGAQRSPPMSAGPHGQQSGNYEMRKAPLGPRVSDIHKHSWSAILQVHESGVEKNAVALRSAIPEHGGGAGQILSA
ncbi:hypothetical protein Hypma_012292 [Hypsizygus marmoreus]|uniref:Uncharacterized protein n=1 Tax=Hypsizygus marmoreus TaxID=39966 RepID=A0A369JHU6_HYPMA|nr:hypothetical protein Hypma_012292 [Hypsizygus marmoreus]